MRAAVHGVDGVGKRKNIFRVAVVVLQRDFDFDRVPLAFHVDRANRAARVCLCSGA